MESETAPRKLTAEQSDAYHRDGFVVVSGVFNPRELQELDEEIVRLLTSRLVEKSVNGRFIHGAGRHSELLYRYSEDPRLLALVEDLVGPGLAIFSYKMLEKQAHDDQVCHWHQDEAYYRGSSGHESDCCLSAWFPTTDAGPGNGGLRVVPGSHKAGVRDDHERYDYATCRLAIRDGHEDLPGAVDCPVQAGDVLLFSAKLLHGSRGNPSDHPRRALIVSYQEATRPVVSKNGRVLRPA